MNIPIIRAAACAVLAVLCCASSAHATEIIVYDLFGNTAAPVELNGASNRYDFNRGYEVQINWEGAVLTHDLGRNLDSFRDDEIRITGEISLCVGQAGGSCFGDGAFERVQPKNGLYAGAGTFRFDDVEFDVDKHRTQGVDDVRARADRNIGDLVLVGQDLGRANKIDLGLKLHPDLNYAFRLFDEDPTGDGLFRILSWITLDSWLFAGRTRSETRPGEAVFNGDLFACRRGAACGLPPDDPTEVPEPMSMFLLGSGLLGCRLSRHRKRSRS